MLHYKWKTIEQMIDMKFDTPEQYLVLKTWLCYQTGYGYEVYEHGY